MERDPGRRIAAAQSLWLERVLGDLFGYHVLQVGRLAERDLLATSRILHRLLVEVDGGVGSSNHPTVVGRASALPVESDSVDVVVMPHILEFEPDPHDAVRESARVLVPEGRLLVSGFNPWSFLGAWARVRRNSGSLPWCGRFLSVTRLKDWLALLGFDLIELETCFFRPPVTGPGLLARLGFMEHVGRRVFPYFGSIYVIHARKRVSKPTAIRPRWQLRRRVVPIGLARPSARTAPRRIGHGVGHGIDHG